MLDRLFLELGRIFLLRDLLHLLPPKSNVNCTSPLEDYLSGEAQFGFGDVYTWTAIDADTKLIPCWHVGTRDADSAYAFIHDLASRLANRIQLTTDGHKAYIQAVEDAFGADIDFAQLIKLYGNAGQTKEDQRRYSPAECTGTEKRRIIGNPNIKDCLLYT